MRRYTRLLIQLPLPLLFLLLSDMALEAQPQLVNSLEINEVIHDIVFRSEVEGYALGNTFVWHTIDGGITWERIRPFVSSPPFTAMALFGKSGLIIGNERGNIFVTPHPDSTWVSSRLVKEGSIKEIEAIDHNRWVAITDTAILSTVDGGLTYRRFVPDGILKFSSVDITNDSLMHVSEEMNRIWRSIDGGTTWNQHQLYPFGVVHDVRFTSADTGFVASWYPWNLLHNH